MRREVLPGGRDDEFGGWCYTHRARPSGARGHGRARAALARSRRGHDCGRGCFRSRARVSRDGPRRDRPRFPAASHRGRARDHPRGCGVRVGGGASHCCHDHSAPPALQPQRDARGRHPAALLLFAGAEARGAPRGAGSRSDERQSEILPRHRQRAACPRRQGDAVRARGDLYGTRGDRALCGGLRAGRGARQARGLRQLPRGGFLPPAAKPWLDHFAQGDLDGAWRDPVRRGDARAAASGRIRRMAARLTGTAERGMPALDAPIFTALTPLLGRLPRDRLPRHDELNALGTPSVVSGGGAPIRFVPPAASAQYEVRIFETGEVQTRPDSWHDLFNALAWLAFPRTKAVLNRHHYEQIKSRVGERLRGTVRDVLTLFDEGGIVVAAADAELSCLLREFRWKELFWKRRTEVRRSMRFYVFGHAIYEKALEPYKGVTAKALILDAAPGLLDAPIERQLRELDARAADYFSGTQALASTRNLSPLPILGIPGWEPANASEEYYDDPSQFRPGLSP